MGTLALILIPAALFVGLVVAFLTLRGVREGTAPPFLALIPIRWLGLTALLLVLGLVIAPRLLGFTFLILPILLVFGSGRRRRGR